MPKSTIGVANFLPIIFFPINIPVRYDAGVDFKLPSNSFGHPY